MDIFANDIDLNGNEFKKLRAENLLSLPTATSSDVGRIVMNTGIGKFYGYDGTNWIPFEGGVGGGSPYVLPTATDTLLGGVKIGNNIDIDIDGVISVSDFPVKQNDTLGSLYWDYLEIKAFLGKQDLDLLTLVLAFHHLLYLALLDSIHLHKVLR